MLSLWPLYFGLFIAVFVNTTTVTLRRTPFEDDGGSMTGKLQRTPVVTVSSSLYDCFDRRLLFIANGSRVYLPRPRRSTAAVLVAMMLLLSGVETNPGPIATELKFGVFNVRGGTHAGAIIQDLMRDHRL